MFPNVLVVAIIATSLIVAILAYLNWRRSHWWVYAAFCLTWAAWAVLYTWVLLADPANYNAARFGATFIRPLNLWSFGLVGAVMLYRYKQNGR